MRITFDEHKPNVDRVTNEYSRSRAKETKRTDCFALDISGMVMDNTAYGVQGRTAEDVMREASAQDVDVIRDYMTVMSNSMSEEDFARLQEEGVNPMDTEIEEVVTIVDKIKAELAKSGVQVIGYTDTLDEETLTQITGSESYANAIRNAFQKADVPMTEENVTDAVRAMQKAQELSTPTEGAEKYMLDNELEPTIDDLYLAEFSGADRSHRQAKGYYREGSGYYTKRPDAADMESLRAQVEQILVREGLEVNRENLQKAEFLVRNNIPLTGKNMSRLGRIQDTRLPVEETRVWQAVATALAEGKPAGRADLYDGTGVYEKAAKADSEVDRLLKQAQQSGNVSGYRQLQEIRLMMTVQANVKLLKSGFSIDTENLEELVEALKNLEQKQAEQMFGMSVNPAADYQLYKESITKTADLTGMPVDLIGRAAGRLREVNINFLHEEGMALQKAYQDAGQSYETMMTKPRRDMGDNIRTAFRNVDDILQEMGLNITDENRRAVRILGYNSTEITEENLRRVKTADRTVQRVIDKLTPPKVLQMIREGVNPLQCSLAEVEEYLDNQESYEEEAEKYSRYLYNLEKSGDISPAEKESYIGIYRMLRQIEKSDGAVIGQLLGSGSQMTFSNLLSAVRSGKVKGMDISVDDSFGGLENLEQKGISITDQIAEGYTKGLTESLEKGTGDAEHRAEYNRQLLQEVRKAGEASEADTAMLKKLEIPVTVDYLLATAALKSDRAAGIRRLWQKREAATELPPAMEHIHEWEECLTDKEGAAETYRSYTEQLAQMTEELTFGADTSLDVRQMQLIHKQLHVTGAAAALEEYDIPFLLEDEMTAVHLTLRHDDNIGGRVSVTMESRQFGKLSAVLRLQEGKVSGYMTAESAKTGDVLRKTAMDFAEKTKESGMESENISVLIGTANSETEGLLRGSEGAAESVSKESTADLYRLSKLFIRSIKATFV